MHSGNQEAQGAQRSAFSRHVAARRASEGPSTARNLSTVRLPTIGRTGGGPSSTAISSAPPTLSGSADHSAGSATQRRGETLISSSPTASPLVISERTSRAQLVSIVAQLQADLSQRTDSVNAIQRNFQRLSAMHHAEQEELLRLRRLQQEMQNTSHVAADAQLEEQKRVIEELTEELRQRSEQETRLQEQVADAERERLLVLKVMSFELSVQEERRHLVEAESSAFADVVRAAALGAARLMAKSKAGEALREEQTRLLGLLHTHASRVSSLTQGEAKGESSPHLLAEGTTQGTSTALDGEDALTTLLHRVEDVVGTFVQTREAATTQRHTAEHAALQMQVSQLQSKLQDMHRAALEAVGVSEAEGRRALESAAADTHSSLVVSFRRGCAAMQNEAQRTNEAQSQLHGARAQCGARVDAWIASAEERMSQSQGSMDEWCRSFEVDFSSQRAALLKRSDEAYELAAARTEWEVLRDTERKAHRAELQHVRQDTAARIANAESRLKASQQTCVAAQRALEETRTAQLAAAEEAERLLEARVKEVAAEREALLGRQWYRVQAAQEAHTQQVVELLWEVSAVHTQCGVEEAAARMSLYHAYVNATVQLSQRDRSAAERAGAARAVHSVRVAHLAEKEAAARVLVEAAAGSDVAQILHAARVEKDRMGFHGQLRDVQQTLHEVRGAHELAAAEHRRREFDLGIEVHNAEEAHRTALQAAADATTAAQDARLAAQRAQEELRAFRSATAAAAHRIEAAESATESACCCPLCLQLLCNPVACVPCGHVFCAGCLLWHARNKSLSSLTASAAPQSSRRASGSAAQRAEVEVAQWMRGVTVPHSRLYCPECGTASVSTLVELRSLGELAAKYSYKKGALLELMGDLV